MNFDGYSHRMLKIHITNVEPRLCVEVVSPGTARLSFIPPKWPTGDGIGERIQLEVEEYPNLKKILRKCISKNY